MMRVVGSRRIVAPNGDTTGEQLLRGAKFNDAMHEIFKVSTGVRPGVYRFKTHAEANAHQESCIAAVMAGMTK